MQKGLSFPRLKKYRAGYGGPALFGAGNGARLCLELGALEGLETTIVQLMKLLMVMMTMKMKMKMVMMMMMMVMMVVMMMMMVVMMMMPLVQK